MELQYFNISIITSLNASPTDTRYLIPKITGTSICKKVLPHVHCTLYEGITNLEFLICMNWSLSLLINIYLQNENWNALKD